jgi:hypothetical protein
MLFSQCTRVISGAVGLCLLFLSGNVGNADCRKLAGDAREVTLGLECATKLPLAEISV